MNSPARLKTLAEALPAEMARVRDELIPLYQTIGPNGRFAIVLMKNDLKRAQEAIDAGDTVEMIRCLAALQEYKE